MLTTCPELLYESTWNGKKTYQYPRPLNCKSDTLLITTRRPDHSDNLL